MSRIEDIGIFNNVREAGMSKLVPIMPRIAVGMGTCGRGMAPKAYITHLVKQSRTAARTSISHT